MHNNSENMPNHEDFDQSNNDRSNKATEGKFLLENQDTKATPRNNKNFVIEIFDKDMINLNVGGEIYAVKWSLLERYPDSRLGMIRFATNLEQLKDLCDEIDIEKQEIYFDKSARFFEIVIGYFHTQKMHFQSTFCVKAFYNELEYWGLTDCKFDRCCYFKFHELKENMESHIDFISGIENSKKDDIEFTGHCKKFRKHVWNTMENPEYSKLAKVLTITSITFVVISTIALIMSTLPDLKIKNNNNGTDEEIIEIDHPVFEFTEVICIMYFTVEYLVRLWSAPVKSDFLLNSLNIIDFISIAPFYVSISIKFISSSLFKQSKHIRKLFTLFRVLRILRIFKLARHSKGLKAFGKTMKMSINELGILFTFLGIAVLLFSSLAYFAEKDEMNTMYTSIPASFWWAIITITTVGYGDMYPSTTLGRIVAVVCCICGILVLAMPIPVIIDNFRQIILDQEIEEKVLKYKNMRIQKEIYCAQQKDERK